MTYTVLSGVLNSTPTNQVASDFEAAVWSAARQVLPGVLQRGCAFHFSQAVWRNIQAVGLQCAYTSDERVSRVCRQTMALQKCSLHICLSSVCCHLMRTVIFCMCICMLVQSISVFSLAVFLRALLPEIKMDDCHFYLHDVTADEFQTLHTASDDWRVAQHLQCMERQCMELH